MVFSLSACAALCTATGLMWSGPESGASVNYIEWQHVQGKLMGEIVRPESAAMPYSFVDSFDLLAE